MSSPGTGPPANGEGQGKGDKRPPDPEAGEEYFGPAEAARDFINYLRVEKGHSVNTLDAYARILRRYCAFMVERGISRPAEIDMTAVRDYALSMGSGHEGPTLSPGSLAQAFSAVRMFHRFLAAEGYCAGDPSPALDSPKLPSRLPRALTRAQVDKLLDIPAADEKGIRDRAILELLYATGMRVSELVGLDLENVDMETRAVTCLGKGGRWRVIPFGGHAADALNLYLSGARPVILRERRSRALVLNMRGQRLTRQGCWKVIGGRAVEAGMGDLVSPHVLRHTFATHLLEGGAGLPVVQQLLGHASIATTQIYTEVTREHLMDVYRLSHPRT